MFARLLLRASVLLAVACSSNPPPGGLGGSGGSSTTGGASGGGQGSGISASGNPSTGGASSGSISSGAASTGAGSGSFPSSGTVSSGNVSSGTVSSGSSSGIGASGGSAGSTSSGTGTGSGVASSGASGASSGSGSGNMSGTSMSGSAQPLPDGGQGIGMDTPPWRPLNVTAPPAQYIHGTAGVDTRAKSIGKLAVDIGVNSGTYSPWLGKRGYHVIGAPCGNCAAPDLGAGRDAVGACRMTEFANTQAYVKSTLATLAQQYPPEDWGYFLNQDGSVRWSDVAITGMSHGATTAAVAGRIGVRMWRVVSRSGPRDDTCGVGASPTPTFDPANPPWMANCPLSNIASWLDKPSITPINRFYGLVGTTDVEYGDIMFNMHYTQYPGPPVQWNVAGAVLTGNQFYSTLGGHLDFLQAAPNVQPANTDQVLNVAFAIPAANQNPAF